jgi:hypothetical protein
LSRDEAIDPALEDFAFGSGATTRPAGWRRADLVDWSSAPTDDPIIAAELARRAEVRQAAAPGPTMAEILAAFLSPPEPWYYAGVVREVSRGELSARNPIAAVERSRGPGVLRPAAVFTSYIERCWAAREARSKRPDG